MKFKITQESIEQFLLYIPLYLLAATIIIPYYWMVVTAFKSVDELTKSPPTIIVTNPVLDSFYDPLENQGKHISGVFQHFHNAPFGFATFILNSLFVSTTVTVISLLIASATAFVLAKHDIPGRNTLFLIFLFSTMIPVQATIVPNFITIRNLDWLNTYYAYIIPSLPKVFAVFLLRQHMINFPNELLDSARLDGASELRIWWQIVMPVVRPVLASLAAFITLTEWNNFLWPLIIVQDESMATIPLALARLNSDLLKSGDQATLMAGVLLSTMPTIAVFLFFHKHFMERVRTTSYYH